MLKKLINFFHEVFLEFDIDEQKVNGDKVFEFQKKFLKLRQKEKKFGEKTFFFDCALINEAAL